MIRIRAHLGCGLMALLIATMPIWSAPARAQDDQPGDTRGKHPRPNSVDRTKDIDFLFGALKAAPDEVSAKAVENRILTLWMVSGSDTADLLMGRVKQAVDAKDVDLGIRLLDSIVEIKPDYVEGWNRRATLYFAQKDYGAAINDLRQVLAREPRHFGAMVGLGMIFHELDEDKLALLVLRKALEIHPHLARVGDLVKTLTEKVEGRPI
jgi:tetratricopeptide (TPR) repeat protein